jgi:putative phosphoesterase
MIGSMLRVGVIADTHGLLRAEAEQALAGSDLILHAGDVGNGDILTSLASIAPVHTVRGNVDEGSWAKSIPDRLRLTLEGVVVLMHHGHLPIDMEELTGAQVVIQGHSHRVKLERRDGVLFLNPGSAGRSRFGSRPSLALLSLQEGTAEARIVDLARQKGGDSPSGG